MTFWHSGVDPRARGAVVVEAGAEDDERHRGEDEPVALVLLLPLDDDERRDDRAGEEVLHSHQRVGEKEQSWIILLFSLHN